MYFFIKLITTYLKSIHYAGYITTGPGFCDVHFYETPLISIWSHFKNNTILFSAEFHNRIGFLFMILIYYSNK